MMKTVDEALQLMLSHVWGKTESYNFSPFWRTGYVVAEDVTSEIDLPPYSNSAVDGYGVYAEDVTDASETEPINLPVSQDIPAGVYPTETLKPKTAARIMTGAPVPPGVNAMIMREDTREYRDRVEILEAAKIGQHIRNQGEEFKTGEVGVRAGTFLDPATIGLLTSLGKSEVGLHRKPLVAIFTTGDEVVDLSVKPLPPGFLYNSNLPSMKVAVEDAHAQVHSWWHLPDDLAATEAALLNVMNEPEGAPDLIVTVGGVSVGDRDFVKPALEKIGTLELWKIAMKPGKPLAFGTLGGALFVGLPGNPVSALIGFEVFERPLLRKMMGFSEDRLSRPLINATLLSPVRHTQGRREFVRAVAHFQDGEIFVVPVGAQGSGMLSGLSQSNALFIVPEEVGNLEANVRVKVMLIEN